MSEGPKLWYCRVFRKKTSQVQRATSGPFSRIWVIAARYLRPLSRETSRHTGRKLCAKSAGETPRLATPAANFVQECQR